MNNTISIVLSPSVEDGKSLTNPELRQITRDYLQGMELSDHQYVAYTHSDRKHKHVHLYVNRINSHGEAYNDSYIGKKSQRIADEVAKKRGLVRAKEVQKVKEHSLKEAKANIKEAHLKVMKSKPTSFHSYTKRMKTIGVDVFPSVNKKGETLGFKVAIKGFEPIKASAVWRGMTLSKITPFFEKFDREAKEREERARVMQQQYREEQRKEAEKIEAERQRKLEQNKPTRNKGMRR